MKKRSAEHCRKISENAKKRYADKEKNPMFGKHHSLEARRKISLASKRFFAIKENHPFYGKTHSKEARKKISEHRKGLLMGPNNPKWKGGKKKMHGYIAVLAPTHPFNCNKYVYEHRMVMEKRLGRYLKPTEIVHHINGNGEDNRIENLILFSNQSEHRRYHGKNKKEK